MAYNPNQPQAKYVATAGQTVFNYLFKVFLNTDLVVYQIAVGDDPEAAVPLLLDVDYAVTISGDDGGFIELTSGAVADDSITIYRRLDLTRYVEYQQSGDLLASTLNNDQDYQTYLIADLGDQVTELLSGDLPGSTADYVRKTGDTMTGALNLASGGSGVQAIQAQEIDAKVDAIDGVNYGIENGGDANNSYTKFPDGTLMCMGRVTITDIASGSVGQVIWTYEAPFIATPEISVTANTNSANFVGVSAIPTATNSTINCHNGAGTTQTRSISCIAIGRWK